MSCTENESGPFVVFFLPAVVGCLTILLARRWANSQVTSGSTTAVSRRRKIIKDPLIKRPLPPVTYKMLPPGSKKTNGVPKKGVFPAMEEEANVPSKRVGRTPRLSPSLSPVNNEPKESDMSSSPPKHIPFPHIPQDGEIIFEIMTFIFTIVATGLQFLNLYRTVWWLPQYNTNYAMNFYLIDPHLVVFIVTILSRRLLLSLLLVAVHHFVNPKYWPHANVAARMFILGVILGALAWCAYFLALKHPLLKLFYLCYPAILYLMLFGFTSGPFLELSNSDTPILHSCSHDPVQIKAEVDFFRKDFNLRIKKMIFNSIIGAYYSSFIPCGFVQSFVYYEVATATQQVAFVWGALFARLASHMLPAAHLDVLHRAALHLRFAQHHVMHQDGLSPPPEETSRWKIMQQWSRNTYCYSRYYTVFKNPSTLICTILCLQLSLVLVQLSLLFSSIPWHGFLSIFLLLFMNYYTSFKLLRDYLVASKVYKVEALIRDKNNNRQTASAS